MVKSGIMYECVKHDVPFVLAGSIRDDGPLPEVITDMLAAQDAMREKIRGVGFCLMVATMLHSIATATCCRRGSRWLRGHQPGDGDQAADRGSHQTVGVVTDAEPFLRAGGGIGEGLSHGL